MVRVRLSEAGREKLLHIDEVTAGLEAELAELFDGKEAKRLRKALRRLSRHLGEQVDPDVEAADILADEEPDEDD